MSTARKILALVAGAVIASWPALLFPLNAAAEGTMVSGYSVVAAPSFSAGSELDWLAIENGVTAAALAIGTALVVNGRRRAAKRLSETQRQALLQENWRLLRLRSALDRFVAEAEAYRQACKKFSHDLAEDAQVLHRAAERVDDHLVRDAMFELNVAAVHCGAAGEMAIEAAVDAMNDLGLVTVKLKEPTARLIALRDSIDPFDPDPEPSPSAK